MRLGEFLRKIGYFITCGFCFLPETQGVEPLVFEIANNFTQEFALPPRGSILLYDYISPTTTANDAFIYIYGDDTWKKIAKHSIISENNVLFKLFKFNIPGFK